ncbi:hypothetical protein Tco_0711226 [Tanacetum coccineum]
MESQSETSQTMPVLKHPVLKTREYDLWIIPVASASAGAEGPIPPKTFHACKDAKSLWEAIKNRFGGNKESKKMQKTILKQNYENFAASSQEGLD